MIEMIASGIQVVVALGLLNVWILRFGQATGYRGGEAKNLKEEFAVYGLPTAVFYIVGALKLSSAAALLGAFFLPELRLVAGATLVVLMLGALAMHIKVKDPLNKSIPALCMLAMSFFLVFSSL